MRPIAFLAAALLACPAVALAQQAAPPAGSAAAQGLSDSQIKRRDALLGQGWQFRSPPIDRATLEAMNAAEGPPAADLSNLDARIKADEVHLTRLRDGQLARGNAALFGIEAALPYGFAQRRTIDIGSRLPSFEPYFIQLWDNIRSIPDRVF